MNPEQKLTNFSEVDLSKLGSKEIALHHAAIKQEFDDLKAKAKAREMLSDEVNVSIPADEVERMAELRKLSLAAGDRYKIVLLAEREVGKEIDDLPDLAVEEETEETSAEEVPAPVETPAEEVPAEVPAETEKAPAEAPTEAPAEIVETEVAPQGELVTANASPVSKVKVKGETASRPFEAYSEDGTEVRSIDDLRRAFEKAASKSSKESVVARFNPYGTNEKRRLGKNADENYELMYGNANTGESYRDRVKRASFGGKAPERMSFTAALNCTGPVMPTMDLPFCFNDNRPLSDSGLISEFETMNGQIQLYGCADMPDPLELIPVPDCGEDGNNCGECGPMEGCFEHTCIEPLDPITPERYKTCMCIPESLRWSNPMAFEHALTQFSALQAQQWEQWILAQIRPLSIIRTVDNALKPQHGIFNTIRRSVIAAIAQKRLGGRWACGGLENYSIFIPGGEELFYASMADQMSRIMGCACPGEDVLEELNKMVGGSITFGEDRDPESPATALHPYTWGSDVALGAPAPLEPIPNAGTIYLIPRDTLGTAVVAETELGLDTRDKCEVDSGCLKMVRSDWRLPLLAVGCDAPVVLDFTNGCYEGSGPDLQPADCAQIPGAAKVAAPVVERG